MTGAEIIAIIFQIVIIPLLGILTKYLVALITTKIEEIKEVKDDITFNKYADFVKETVTNCVLATNQTYVDALKEQGKFDAEAQKVAFQKTFEAVMNILSADAKKYLTNAIGDLDKYVTDAIEAQVTSVKTVVG